jgi:hypothetical protein
MSESDLTSALNYLTELGAIELHGAELWIPSCETRLGSAMKKRETARENGHLGGRPPKENNPTITQEKPNGFTTEKKTEKKTETEKKTTTEKKDAQALSLLTVLDFPDDWQSEDVYTAWTMWLDYKKNQFKFTFKSETSERVAKTQLYKMPNGKKKLQEP